MAQFRKRALRSAIVSRYTARRYGAEEVVRVLSCGHEQVEPRGGKAGSAEKAECLVCTKKARDKQSRVDHEAAFFAQWGRP
jgi:hypothetical protein